MLTMEPNLDEIEELFCGTWKHDHDENFEQCLKKLDFPGPVADFMVKSNPVLKMKRNGNSFDFIYEMSAGAKPQKYNFEMNKEFESKDDSQPPMYHNKEICTYDSKTKKLKFVSYSQLEGPLKVDTETVFWREGDKLHTPLKKLGATSKEDEGDRVMVLVSKDVTE